MKKKTDYQVSIRTMYKRLKKSGKELEESRGIVLNLSNQLEDANAKIFKLVSDNDQLREDGKRLLREKGILMEQRARFPHRGVDPQAEVVMNMKRALEYAINTSAALLDGMGELVDHVSGRKERRERDQERDLSIVDDPTGERG